MEPLHKELGLKDRTYEEFVGDLIDGMSVPEIVVHVSQIFIANGCDPSEVPSTGEENYVAFRKLLKCLIKTLPNKKLVVNG